MKIAPRLLLGYASLALLVVVVGLAGYRAVLRVGAHFDHAMNRTQPVLAALQDIRFVAVRLLVDLEARQHGRSSTDKRAARRHEDESRSSPTADFSMLDVTLARYQGLIRLYYPEEAATSASITQKAAQLKASAAAFLTIPAEREDEQHAKFDDLRSALAELLDVVNEATEREYAEFTEYQRGVAGQIALQSNAVLLIGIVSFLLALLLGIYLARRISGPIVELRDAATRVGRGQFNARVEAAAAGGELGDLAQAFNAMSDRLSQTMVSRDYVANIVDSMAEALVVVDAVGIIRRHNPAMHVLAACATGVDLVGVGLAQMFVEPERLRALLAEARAGDRIELEMRTQVGGLLHVSMSASRVRGGESDARDTVVLIQDISERRRHEERLSYLANYDALTGLPNRVLTLDLLRQSLARLPWSERHTAVLFCDLDRFKLVNDTLGHATGDVLLQRVAERLKACVRPGDVVARMSGDEFLLVLNEIGRVEDIGHLAQKVVDELRRPMQIGPNELFVSASVGICVAPEDGSAAETLLKQADLAMYAAKGAGKNAFRFYSESMSLRSQQRLELEAALRRSLLEGECLQVHYQPQTGIDGTLIGFEALVRWQHPQLGLIAPASFLPMATEAGLMASIDESVLGTACSDLRVWRAAGNADLRVAVNISVQTFHRPDLVELVGRVLDAAGLPPDALELELTETMLADDIEQASTTLQRLRDLGVSLSIDDYGVGYSSLAQLKRCPIRLLKIDRSFVTNLISDHDDAAIAEAIVVLSHKFGIDVLAVGVETREQLAKLQACGCDAVQGYLLSPPVAASAVPELIALLGGREGGEARSTGT